MDVVQKEVGSLVFGSQPFKLFLIVFGNHTAKASATYFGEIFEAHHHPARGDLVISSGGRKVQRYHLSLDLQGFTLRKLDFEDGSFMPPWGPLTADKCSLGSDELRFSFPMSVCRKHSYRIPGCNLRIYVPFSFHWCIRNDTGRGLTSTLSFDGQSGVTGSDRVTRYLYYRWRDGAICSPTGW